jgi:hypothetical protein
LGINDFNVQIPKVKLTNEATRREREREGGGKEGKRRKERGKKQTKIKAASQESMTLNRSID